jgi:hypothetical protein
MRISSLHVSGDYVPFIRRNNCIYATLGTSYSVWMTVWYAYFFSLHVSGDYVPIIRRNNCIYATLGASYSVWITVWDAPCKPNDGHIVARNMYKKEINILRKIVHQFGFIYKIIQGCRSTERKRKNYLHTHDWVSKTPRFYSHIFQSCSTIMKDFTFLQLVFYLQQGKEIPFQALRVVVKDFFTRCRYKHNKYVSSLTT